MLVALAAERLKAAGVDLPQTQVERPWHRLYDILNSSDPRNAHSRYDALLRRVASFARAAEHASSR